jgi:pimeloyl-ACP methyl ester carboxylesterase
MDGDTTMITLDGRSLATRWWGTPTAGKPALVLLHEGLGCVQLWRDVPERLAQATGLAVFAWSRFGYGASATVDLPRPLTYLYEEGNAVLPRVLAAAGIDAAILVGHSDGASIAAIYAGGAGLRPDAPRLDGVVVIAPHYFVEPMCLPPLAEMRTAFTTGDLRARLARYHADVDAAFCGWNGAWLDPAFRTWDITDHISRIRAPLLQMQGTDDGFATDAHLRAAERLAAGPVETLLLPARHAPHLEAPADTDAAIAAFVRRVTAAPAAP